MVEPHPERGGAPRLQIFAQPLRLGQNSASALPLNSWATRFPTLHLSQQMPYSVCCSLVGGVPASSARANWRNWVATSALSLWAEKTSTMLDSVPPP